MVSQQKIQRKAPNGEQQALQKFKKIPEKLGYLIEIVNCLPPDGSQLRSMNPESLRSKVEAEFEQAGETKDESPLDVRLEVAACESTKMLPTELRDYVWRGEWKGGSFHVEPTDTDRTAKILFPILPGAFRRYAEVWDAYEKLHGIAKVTKEPPQHWKLVRLGRHASIPATVVIDARGMVRERKSLFSKAIEDQDIEAVRIRACPVCTRIFWAGRITQKCCTPKCANTFRVHRHRYRTDEEKEAYNWRRYEREKNRQMKAHATNNQQHSKSSDTENGV